MLHANCSAESWLISVTVSMLRPFLCFSLRQREIKGNEGERKVTSQTQSIQYVHKIVHYHSHSLLFHNYIYYSFIWTSENIHIVWSCPVWDGVRAATKNTLDFNIELPKDLDIKDKYIFKILMVARKKAITRHWLLKEPPTLK